MCSESKMKYSTQRCWVFPPHVPSSDTVEMINERNLFTYLWYKMILTLKFIILSLTSIVDSDDKSRLENKVTYYLSLFLQSILLHSYLQYYVCLFLVIIEVSSWYIRVTYSLVSNCETKYFITLPGHLESVKCVWIPWILLFVIVFLTIL